MAIASDTTSTLQIDEVLRAPFADVVELLAERAGWNLATVTREFATGAGLRITAGVGGEGDRASARFFPEMIPRLEVYPLAFNGAGGRYRDRDAYLRCAMLHELAHAWDAAHGFGLSAEFRDATAGTYEEQVVSGRRLRRYVPGPCDRQLTRSGGANHFEDFAESFAAVLWGDTYLEARDGHVDAVRAAWVSDALRRHAARTPSCPR